MKRILILLLLITTSCSAFIASNGVIMAAEPVDSSVSAKSEVCRGLGLTPNPRTGDCKSEGVTINRVLEVVLNLLSAVAAIAAIIMIMISGMRYVTSAGDSAGVQGAKNTIIYAIVGLIIVAVSQAIVQIVINRTTK